MLTVDPLFPLSVTETDSPPPSKPTSAASSAVGRRRGAPKWSLTSEAAQAAEVQEGEEEADELLAFARGLDFDKYIDDVEIKTMMEQVRRGTWHCIGLHDATGPPLRAAL